jgi:hypothetical protein
LLLVFASPVVCYCGLGGPRRRSELHSNDLLLNQSVGSGGGGGGGSSSSSSGRIDDAALLDYRREEVGYY